MIYYVVLICHSKVNIFTSCKKNFSVVFKKNPNNTYSNPNLNLNPYESNPGAPKVPREQPGSSKK